MNSRVFAAMERGAPHLVSNRGVACRIAFRRWRILDCALQFNDNQRTIVAAIAAGLRVISLRTVGANER
jgi:hypothetical protein